MCRPYADASVLPSFCHEVLVLMKGAKRWRLMTDWRAWTVQPPWSWAIVYGGKDVENRSWPIPAKYLRCGDCGGGGVNKRTTTHGREYGGKCWDCDGTGTKPFRVMLHAGAKWGNEALNSDLIADMPGFNVRACDLSAVVAVVEFTGQHQAGDCLHAVGEGIDHTHELCSVWAMDSEYVDCDLKPMWHWEIGKVTPLAVPVPATGRLRFWPPDEATIRNVEAQL